jgi:hypothetical protein
MGCSTKAAAPQATFVRVFQPWEEAKVLTCLVHDMFARLRRLPAGPALAKA